MIGRYLRTVVAGFRLALLGRPRLDPAVLTPGMIWVFALVSAGLSCGLSYLGTEIPRKFVPDGLQTEAFDLTLTLLAGFLLARAFAEPRLLWRLPVLLIVAGLLPTLISYAVYDHLLPHRASGEHRVYYLCYALMLLWWTGILFQALSLLTNAQPLSKRVTHSAYVIALMAVAAYPLNHQRFWEKDYAAEYQQQQQAQKQKQPEPLVAETVLAMQPGLLDNALSAIPAGETGNTEMYFVGFGGDGRQQVFTKEVRYVARQFQTRFATRDRSLTLVNDRAQVERQPMASVSNLRAALQALGRRMNVDEDILFLFLTSHGSKTHELAVELGGISLLQLSAGDLASMLHKSGIRWRVIVVSGCYSGGFVKHLKSAHALVITSARADRKSFGCDDMTDFTYFGRAYFEQALNQTTSFTEAFHKAKLLVRQWETEEKYDPSEPQMAVGSLIEDKLKAWQSGIDAASAGQPAAGLGPRDVVIESAASH